MAKHSPLKQIFLDDIIYRLATRVPVEQISADYNRGVGEINRINSAYWSRWHELEDIKSQRRFTEPEKEEYAQYETVINKLDDREARYGRIATKPLLDQHGKVIASMHGLAEDIKKATEVARRKKSNRNVADRARRKR